MDLIKQELVEWTPEISTAKRVDPYEGKVYCNQCNHLVTQDLYTFGSDYNLCKSCYPLPNQIHHWLHKKHPLTLQTKQLLTTQTSSSGYDVFCFICDGCLYVSFGRVYVCQDCEFRCCIECSFSTATRMPIEWEHNDKSIFHYIHLHELTRCRYKRRLDIKNRDCLICELPLWGICYGCVRCACFIHESCVDSPEQILHPIHPSHPLKRLNYAQDYSHGDVCKGCTHEIWRNKHFFCEECGDFNFHLKCADSLLQTIQHQRHPHALLYSTPPTTYTSDAICGICNNSVSRRRVAFYRCVECNLTFHFKCIPIPFKSKHPYHLHPLSLVYSFLEGDSYCNICETSRKPYEHAYCCKQCSFAAHIACVLSKEESTSKFLSCLSHAATFTKSSTRIDMECYTNDTQSQEQIRHMSHNHLLNSSDAPTDLKHCKMCNLEIDDSAFTCQRCDFWVHKKCVDLPQELDHPLHGCRSLTLLKNFRYGRTFMCNLCRDVSDTFCFLCRACGFIIDVKCAFATQDKYSNMDHIRELVHPVFGRLQLINPTGKYASMSCNVCNQKISGLRYSSLNTDSFGFGACEFFHEKCVQLPLEVEQHILHPNHALSLTRLDAHFDYNDICEACGYRISAYGYSCRKECSFSLHIECARSLSRLLKHETHHHRLYYIHSLPRSIGCGSIYQRPGRIVLGPTRGSTHVCSLCDSRIKGSYYRCIECKLNFHLKCLGLPRTVTHKWHLHRLVYKESVDFGGCYCDICEEERDVQHPVYCCEDCKLVAHVDCLVSEENASSVVIEEIENEDAECRSNGLESIKSEDTDKSEDVECRSNGSESIESEDTDKSEDAECRSNGSEYIESEDTDTESQTESPRFIAT